ncbi:MAG TPA: enoyl-CoA hydratase/isomerase family protein [Pseudonocardiaceae bacterium]|nr:enoyl-CoA hydratase/isomerase family protein [Pseudonocardiaceae bacterium]
MPFSVTEHDGLLELSLDTPKAPINIFTLGSTRQLLDIMSTLDTDRIRAVVIRSAKPGSFINGGDLMRASVVLENAEAIQTAIGPHYEAYDAVRESPVPVIALVQGNCFGCGLELMLRCSHRLAVDTPDTLFRMTELTDYHMPLIFGGTHLLPLQLGLAAALDLMIWDARWNAPQAHAHQLVHHVAPAEDIETALREFAKKVIDGKIPAATERRYELRPEDIQALAAARRHIAEMPPIYQPARSGTVDLMERAARSGAPHDPLREFELFAKTGGVIKNTYQFFHIRYNAATLAGANTPPTGNIMLEFPVDAPELHALRMELSNRDPNGAQHQPADATPPLWSRLVPIAAAPQDGAVAVALSFTHRTVAHPTVLYWPAGPGSRFIELRELHPGALPGLAGYLHRLGYEVAVSRGSSALGTSVLISRFVAVLVAALSSGYSRESIEATLRASGWIRRPGELLAAMPATALAEAIRPHLPGALRRHDRAPEVLAAVRELASPARWREGQDDPALRDALTVSLLAAVLHNLDIEGFAHPYSIDLAAREMLDFPLHETSLCRYLTPERLACAADAPHLPTHLFTPEDLAIARRFATGNRRFYR